MASFQTHLSVAAGTAITVTAACLQAGVVTPSQAVVLIALGIFAGILPDVDSDHSVPVRMLFNLIGIAAALAVLFRFQHQLKLPALLALMLLATVVVRYVVHPAFSKLTEHRGLFHSVPAALLFGLATFSSGYHLLGWSNAFAWLAAAFVCGGYLLHLLLDELYSVNFMGSSLKGSFGTALTLFKPASWAAYLLLYVAIGYGFYALPLPAQLLS